MICPNCDSILNAHGCHSCGWKRSDPWPSHRTRHDSVHPLKPGANYPVREIEAGKPIVLKDFGQPVADIHPSARMPIFPVSDYGVVKYANSNPPPPPQTDGEKTESAYIVGELKDENGEPAGHIMVGPLPGTTVVVEPEVPAEKAIPDPVNKTVQ